MRYERVTRAPVSSCDGTWFALGSHQLTLRLRAKRKCVLVRHISGLVLLPLVEDN